MRSKMQRWHTTSSERLIKKGKDNYDEKWGRFPPECRLNIDQSPCPVMFDSNCTYHQFTENLH